MTEVLLATLVFTGLVMALALIVLAARAVIWGRGQAHIGVNGKIEFDNPLGGKLLDALAFAGVHLPSSCGGAGTCGLCRVRVSGADDEALPVERVKLSPRDVKDGYRLACQVVVRGDMLVDVAPEFLETNVWTCRVVATRTLSPLIKEIVFALPDGETHDLPAGSYVQVNAPALHLPYAGIEIGAEHEAAWDHMGLRKLTADHPAPQSRAYSLVLRPGGPPRLTLNIRLALPPANAPDAPPGHVSSYLFGVKPGDEVEIAGPFGHFFVQDGEAEMIFIGGGVGMAPLYTHVYDQLETEATTRRVSYWYGARGLADLYYADEMAALAARHANFTWHPVLSEPAPGDAWSGATGFVHDALFDGYLKDHPAPDSCEYYLCGPPLMIKAVRALLERLNVPRENVFSDDFGT